MGLVPETGSKLDVRLMEALDEEEDSLGIRGRLAILLIVGAFGRILESDRLADAVVAAVVMVTDDDVNDDETNDDDWGALRRSTKLEAEPLRSNKEL